MSKEIFTETELKDLGFVELKGAELDDGGFYRWFSVKVGGFRIDITYDYHKDKTLENTIVEVCNEPLKKFTKEDVLDLLKILKKCN